MNIARELGRLDCDLVATLRHRALHGDIDVSGDIVDRVDAATGTVIGFPRDRHIALVAGLVAHARALARERGR